MGWSTVLQLPLDVSAFLILYACNEGQPVPDGWVAVYTRVICSISIQSIKILGYHYCLARDLLVFVPMQISVCLQFLHFIESFKSHCRGPRN